MVRTDSSKRVTENPALKLYTGLNTNNFEAILTKMTSLALYSSSKINCYSIPDSVYEYPLGKLQPNAPSFQGQSFN